MTTNHRRKVSIWVPCRKVSLKCLFQDGGFIGPVVLVAISAPYLSKDWLGIIIQGSILDGFYTNVRLDVWARLFKALILG